jgi:hypothetical protein
VLGMVRRGVFHRRHRRAPGNRARYRAPAHLSPRAQARRGGPVRADEADLNVTIG